MDNLHKDNSALQNKDRSHSKSSRSTRQRHFYDEAQLAVLNAEFARHSFPSRECRLRIALLIGVSSKSVMWWFQNRRRRVRQRGFRSAAQTYETSRQHSQSSPYAPCHRVQKDVLPHCLSTPGLYTQTEEDRPKNCWANESTTTSPQFLLGSQSTDWAANRQDNPQLALVSYSSGYQFSGYQPTDQQEQGYSYWSNWEIPSSSNVIQKTAIMYPEMQDPYNYFNAPCWNNVQL
ncbi:hypothetical protein GHT06_000216 [Daphnia sinensis]|uniref:Homeobox domain-containing protein n=1 Tax=Daphnia sinensis TaxID=1820382 RepID=A0AAD5KGK9_9CRUS|nr:hypothetical protein GHT06_005770 [Daphnia sinensis]KAI9550875.1 hypothetical protein GHT06_000216 [Daphnia sinensis]